MKNKIKLGEFIDRALQGIEDWVRIPHFDDRDLQRKAEIMHTLSYVILLMALATISITPFVFTNAVYGLSITISVLLFTLLLLVLNRLGRTTLAAHIFVIVIWSFDTAIIILTGGMESDYLLSYITITVMGGLILGNLSAYLLAGLSTFSFLVLFFLDNQGILPPAVLHFTPIAVIIVNGVSTFLAATTLVLVLLKYEENFKELTEKESTLSNINQKLGWEISARMEAETLLRQSEKRLRSALMESSYPTMLHTGDGEVLLVNTAWIEKTGYSAQEASTLDEWLDLFYRDHRDEVEGYISRLVSKSAAHQDAYFDLLTKKGENLSWYLRWTLLPELPDGRCLILTMATDMTSLLNIESALRKSEENYSKYTLVTNDGLWDWDLVTDEVVFDPHYYTMAGYEVNEFPHQLEEFRKRVHPDDVERVFKAAENHLQGKKEDFMIEFRFQKKDGSWLWIMGRGKITEQDEFGNPLRFVGTHTNISFQKAIEEQLNQQHLQLEQIVKDRTQSLNERISEVERLNAALTNILDDYQTANEKLTALSAILSNAYQELESFTYSLSNDLQDPLKAIKTNASQLMDKPPKDFSPNQLDILGQIHSNASLVDQRISDLLAISLVNRQEAHIKQVDTKVIAEKALKAFSRDIKEHNIKAKVKDLPPCQADPEMLERVFSNLIGNAIKYTQKVDDPEITVGTQPSESPGKVVYFVRDNGIGFKMKDQDEVFRTFGKLHGDADDQGSGVGLAIAKIIINKHGGEIWTEAKQGSGATFYFELSLPPAGRAKSKSGA
jgi:PAS domain S-box-containing protein